MYKPTFELETDKLEMFFDYRVQLVAIPWSKESENDLQPARTEKY